MAATPHLRPAPGSIPRDPGVYRFRDAAGQVIYVGKAKNLRARLSSYFRDFAGLHPRTQQMVSTAADVDWTVVGTEVEALQLEYSWIKQYDPRFNVKYRDDKSYPYLAVTLQEEFPRVQVMRGAKRRGVRYFGPYSHAWAIRETVDLMLRVFPVRTCSSGVFRGARNSGRPCLLGYIGKCVAPCVGKATPEEHRALVEDFCSFLAGDTGRFIRELEARMAEAAREMEYERAARVRDDIGALRAALEKQAVVLPDSTDCDVIAMADDQLEAAVQIFHVRGGRIRGQRGYVVDKVTDAGPDELMETFLGQLYGGAQEAADEDGGTGGAVPRQVLVSDAPADTGAVASWLSGLRGSAVDVRVPRRGDKRDLMETVAKNAREALARHKTHRAGDLSTRGRALNEVQEALDLPEAPLRIECYDVSNLQGEHVVASMVVFEDGLARKSEYRRFSIRGSGTGGAEQHDVAAMYEVIKRRFTRYLEESAQAGEVARMGESGEHGDRPVGDAPPPGKFAYPPNLVVVDGARPQAEAARRALEELGIEDIAVCGLAKRLEEVWLPDDEDPVILPRAGEGLYLLQRVRDEAHRFAVAYHRQKRAKALTGSRLDDLPGLGPTRRTALIKEFGSVRRLSSATAEEIAAVPGIGPKLAEAVHAHLSGEPAGGGGRDDGPPAQQGTDGGGDT
ncbi:excinuclease ABC subunit C [Nocardiopsis sp. CNR-923]|uniref:excinuclease ABC subunit UvrC n=1 Tax=Nocardiopsis sp. CNR-923 TaxID=1904965 RepID=UPI00095C0218|nr:excinuclease ABC subunit UvrC [Nocardiopsis sp. CNR-923]OLT30319.1 excinuclease ABC subunit C [Nocardiopsis sp. CNR-923]